MTPGEDPSNPDFAERLAQAFANDRQLQGLQRALDRVENISAQATADMHALHEREIAITRERHDAPRQVDTNGWTVSTAMTHLLALRAEDQRFAEERDRRYAEVNVEKEKALKIKETADLAALQLAREIQTYKDEKANELREQIGAERGLYITVDKFEDTIKSNAEAREAALVRVNEKFDDYVKRYEVRQREVDQALTIMKTTSENTQRVTEDQARKTNRNIAIMGLVLAVVVALANHVLG